MLLSKAGTRQLVDELSNPNGWWRLTAQCLLIDASHGNSGKDYQRQPAVAGEIAAQVAEGERGIVGVMIESFIADGRQDLKDPKQLAYGQSITDACIGWQRTVPVLQELATAVRARRSAR